MNGKALGLVDTIATAPATDNPKPTTNDRWVLVESGGSNWRLLAIGSDVYPGLSVSHHVPSRVARVMRPAYDLALQSGEDAEFKTMLGDRPVYVFAHPIRSPKTRTVVAVQMIHTDQPEKPTMPPVGSWEWLVPGSDPKSMALYWDKTLGHDIYEEHKLVLEPGEATWRAPQWLGTRIVEPDRPRVKELIDLHSARHDGRLGVEQHDIITQADSPRPGTKRIQMAGRATLDPQTNIVWMRGVSHEVSSNREATIAELFIARGFEFLGQDIPAAAIDRQFHERFSVTEAWLDLGLVGTAHAGTYDSIVHVDDRDVFEETVRVAVQESRLSAAPRLIRLATTSGGWATGQLTAYFVDQPGRYAWVKFLPVTTISRP